MTQVIAVGDNCLDLFLTRGQMAFGGNALNVAVQWHRMGLQARYFGAVGADATGALMREAVLKAGLRDEMEILPGTTAVTLLEEVAGDRRFLLEDLGCGLHYIPDAPRMQAVEFKSGATISSDWQLTSRLWQQRSGEIDGVPVIVYGGESDSRRANAHFLSWRTYASNAKALA